jgi:hypothetical protein
MVPNIIAVLDPTAKSKVKEIPTAPRVNDLNGKVVGFLWNKKANGDLLLLRIKEQLSERFKLAGTNWHQKSSSGVPADRFIIEELVRTADVVINGQGD